MPSAMLEFGRGSWPTLDESTIDGQVAAQLIDGYQDEQGVYHKRPGKVRLGVSSISLPVQGIYWSTVQQTFYAVGGGKLYKVSPAGVVTEMLGGSLPADKPAIFTESAAHVYACTGGKVLKTDGTTSEYESDVAVASLMVTHAAWLDGHVIMNEGGTNRFHWTDADVETFGAGNFAEANADYDNIVALGVGWRELVLLGTRSTEIWYNTGETPGTFERLEGAFIERGCSAPYSLCKVDNTWFFLDHERAFVRLEGRNPKVVSSPVAKQLRDLPDVGDLVCSTFQFNQRRFILLSSQSQGISWVYDYVLDAWYEWGQWQTSSALYSKWPIHSFAYSPELNQYMALGEDGLFYTITGEASDARFLLRSAHQSYGSYDRKIIKELRMRVKRGYVSDDTSPVFWVRWRDDNGAWSNEHFVSLNPRGKFDNVARLQRLGQCRTRQFEFVQSDPAPFAFVGAEIEV